MKNFLCLLLCFLMLLSFTACGKSQDDNSSSDTASEETSSVEPELLYEEQIPLEEVSSYKQSSTTFKKSNSSAKTTVSPGKNQVTNTSGATSTAKRYPQKQKTIQIRKANQSCFKKIGRCDVTSYIGIGLNWTCSSVEFDIDCTEDLAVEISKGDGKNPVFVEIYVDGKLIEERTKIEDSAQITIANGLEPGVHRVKIVRQSDCECPTLTLTKILAYGELVTKAPADNSLYIEAIGDANLVGWGVRLDDAFYADYSKNSDEKKPIARNKENQDGTLAYTYVAAEKLNADTYTLARQGAGIAATYHRVSPTGPCNPKAGLLPTMYQYTAISNNTKYTPSRLPDVIVIDAGSADIAKSCLDSVLDGDKLGIDIGRAGEISVNFLKYLRTQNPDAKIIWCYGLTNSSKELENYVQGAIGEAGGEKAGFYSLKLTTSTRNGYPSAKEHAAAANLLVNKIKQVIK